MAERTVLDQLLSAWELEREQGRDLAPEELCRDHPELLGEVRQRVQALRAWGEVLTTRTADGKPQPGPRPLPAVDGYELLEELGRGGMGVVYKARDLRLKRLVALKMILAGAHAGAAQRERFRREAEAVARLQHPHIVQVFALGEQDGLPYFALELVEGGSLDRRLNGQPQPPRESAELVRTLALAVQAAHEAGVVHRDLKPANVLLADSAVGNALRGVLDGADAPAGTARRPFPTASVPKITDFGLAKLALAEAADGPTQQGAVLGTPAYMAPEQAAGRGEEVGPAADVWALGVILYECLTGAVPFRGASALDVLEQVVAQEPVPPRRLQPKVPRDLETICLECLQKAPHRRYATARALADDLGRFLAGEPIHARPVGALERAGKWARRRPVVAGLLGLLALVTAVGVGLVLWQWGRAVANAKAERVARAEADDLRIKAEGLAEKERRAREDAESALALNAVALANREWYGGSADRARQALASCPPGRRAWEWHYLTGLDRAPLFDWAAPGAGPPPPLPRECWLELAARAAAPRFPEVRALDRAYSPDGKLFLRGRPDGGVEVIDLNTGRARALRTRHRHSPAALAFSADGRRFASAADGLVLVHDRAGKEVASCSGHKGAVLGLGFSPDGARLVTLSLDGTARLWDAGTGKEVRRLAGRPNPGSDVRFGYAGRFAAAGGDGNTGLVWDLETGRAVLTLKGHEGPVYSVDLSAGTGLIATGSADGTVRVWDNRGRPLRALRGHAGRVAHVAFSADGERVASLGPTRALVKVWAAKEDQERRLLADCGGPVRQLALSGDGRRLLAVAGSDWREQTIHLLDLAGKARPVRVPVQGSVFATAFAADGRSFFLSTGALGYPARGRAVTRYSPDGKEMGPLKGLSGLACALAASPDGQRLALLDRAPVLRLWPLPAGPEPAPVKLPAISRATWHRLVQRAEPGGAFREWVVDYHGPGAVAFSYDGKRLAAACPDGSLLLREGGRTQSLVGNEARVEALAFSPDGALLASAGGDGVVRLWAVAEGKQRLALRGHAGSVRGLAFHPTQPRLTTGDDGGRIRLWATDTGQEVLALPPRDRAVTGLAFTPDGRELLASDEAGRVDRYLGGPDRSFSSK
jgi:WD40 repeat protein